MPSGLCADCLRTVRVSRSLSVGCWSFCCVTDRRTWRKKLADEALAQHSSPEVRIAQAQILAAQHKLESARQSLQRAMDDCHDLTMLARIHEVRADLESQAGQVHRAAAERAEAERLRREAK
jgi:hypothetical protein